MRREELEELHYIAPLSNVVSICEHGILSHNRAKKVKHRSVAMKDIQQRRMKKIVPNARPLHDYVNLYFCARNPMLYKLKHLHESLCIMRVDTCVLDLPGVVLTDGNAAAESSYIAFYPSPDGLAKLDHNAIFARYWTDRNQAVQWRKASMKCAEVLVPDCIDPCFIIGAYFSCRKALNEFDTLGTGLSTQVNNDLFFQ